jgi:polar amino acid transport system substrate-binding protein
MGRIGTRALRAVLLGFACASALCGHAQETVKIVTEEFPPYNFTERGRITGLGTEVVEAVLKEMNVTGQIQSMPWARAYDTALNTENVLIYSISRTEQRDKLFKWVGVIAPGDWYLFSLPARNLRFAALDEAKALQTGTVNEDVGEQFLVSRGFVIGKNLQSSNKYEANYQKLKMGRVDLWVANRHVAAHIARGAGDDPSKVLAPAYHFPDLGSEGNYMAFGPKTSEAYVDRFRKALEAIKKKGIYDAIQKKWL